MLKYRPDIDGLRAVAVLSVLLFHVGIFPFRGGFVGVDIFFVISGYLISLVVYEQVVAGTFSYAAFYERRIRRIFPAFFGALIFTGILAYLYLMPRTLLAFSHSLVATIFSVSNFYFWVHSGYFDAPAASEPLLQTWSLAVEEQFYLFLPILLVFGHRMFGRVGPMILILAALSLVASAASVVLYPEAAFYMLHTRAWELLLGSMVSLRLVPDLASAWRREVAACLGVVLIAVAIFGFTPSTPFPGAAALVPCLGAALILAAGRTGPSVVGRLLAMPAARFVGLISYSLYLWHWPILVFQREDSFLIDASPRVGKAVVIIASLVAGALSWRLIERPFRRPGVLTRRRVFLAAGTGTLAAGLAAALLLVVPSRFSPQVVAIASYLGDPGLHLRDGRCFISSRYNYSDYDRTDCLAQTADGKNDLLVGDSHAAHLWYGLSQVFEDVNFLQATAAGCKPTLAATRHYGQCNEVMNEVFNAYLLHHHVDRLLIAARWTSADLPALGETLDWAHLHGIRVTVFGPIVQYDSALPRILALALQAHDPSLPGHHNLDEGGLDREMAALAAAKSASYISLDDVLCPAEKCVVMAAPGVPLQFDYSHLTKEGSVLLAQRLSAAGLLP